MRKSSLGFSLVELVTTIGIIGTLAAVSVPNLQGFQYRAQRAKVVADTTNISRVVQALRVSEEGRTLTQITGSTCSMCSMQAGTIATQTNALNSQAANWRKLGFDQVPRDPWGNPYMLDENEGEYGPTDCRLDAVWSGGPNGKWEGWSDITNSGKGDSRGVIDQVGQDDDLVMLIPPSAGCNR